MNILIIGSGGREHALGWKISQSKKVGDLFFAPGNAGTAALGKNLEIEVCDFPKIKTAVLKNGIDLVLVGPEVPLVEGIHDFFAQDAQLHDIKLVGPDKTGAQLEGSKDFAKDFMMRHNIPTARHFTVTRETLTEGLEFLESLEPPFVLKADGLAAGKGVLILDARDEAKSMLKEMLGGMFGAASKKVVIEEFLRGVEVSVFILTDGKNYKILPEAKDYKRIGEGNTGLNTGGMGAISPVPFAGHEFMKKVESRIIRPTVNGLVLEKIDYKGFIFFGLIEVGGDPFVIEYNVRLGDPEAQAILPRVKTDFVDLLSRVAEGNLNDKQIEMDDRFSAAVVLVSGGYPGSYEKGKVISGLEEVSNSTVFHAGTKSEEGKILTSGGRVLAVSSLGKNMAEALAQSYKNAEVIRFDKKYYRKDLGFDL